MSRDELNELDELDAPAGKFPTCLPPAAHRDWRPGDAPPILFVHSRGQPGQPPGQPRCRVLRALRGALPGRTIIVPLYQNNDVPDPTPGKPGCDDVLASLQVPSECSIDRSIECSACARARALTAHGPTVCETEPRVARVAVGTP